MKKSLAIGFILEKGKSYKTRLCSCLAILSLWSRTMQGLYVLRFDHPDRTDKTNRLNHVSVLKMAVKMTNVVKQLANVCIKIVSTYRCQYSLFSDPLLRNASDHPCIQYNNIIIIRRKKIFWIWSNACGLIQYVSKISHFGYRILRIQLRRESFGSIIGFLDFSKERKYPFSH